MTTKTIILDCFTDEPSGLGVPPYLGTYPRYIAGKVFAETNSEARYVTIDDLRNTYRAQIGKPKAKQPHMDDGLPRKTDISTYSLTQDADTIHSLFSSATEIIIILGVQTPGKYLSAYPGTFSELKPYLSYIKSFNKDIKITLTGPAATEFGSGLFGGQKATTASSVSNLIQAVIPSYCTFEEIDSYVNKGAYIVKQIPYEIIVELETGVGCPRKIGCSFCTEPLKNKTKWRDSKNIIKEAKMLSSLGMTRFRLGKQTCFYSYKGGVVSEISALLKGIFALKPEVLHIDNVNPVRVTEAITKEIVKYCTPGNVAAFGVESFDPDIYKANNLNTTAEQAYNAIKIINKFGKNRGKNGMPLFLPGLNLLFGLPGETKKTHEINMRWLKRLLDEDLLVRRINIRQVVAYPGTPLASISYKVKTKKWYWKWRNEIRTKIDNVMLASVAPLGTIISDVFLEIHDGNHTFGRQFGSYPLIIGINERLPLKQFVDVEITKHQLRSLTGKIVKK